MTFTKGPGPGKLGPGPARSPQNYYLPARARPGPASFRPAPGPARKLVYKPDPARPMGCGPARPVQDTIGLLWAVPAEVACNATSPTNTLSINSFAPMLRSRPNRLFTQGLHHCLQLLLLLLDLLALLTNLTQHLRLGFLEADFSRPLLRPVMISGA